MHINHLGCREDLQMCSAYRKGPSGLLQSWESLLHFNVVKADYYARS